MFGHSYGGSCPPDENRHHPQRQEQSAMMQGRYQDPPPHHPQHHPPQYDSSPFHRQNSHYPPEERYNPHYPPAGPPPFWPHDELPRLDASYPAQASSFCHPQHESFYPPPPQQPHSAFYPPQHGVPHSSSLGEHFPPTAAHQHGQIHPQAYFLDEQRHSSEFAHVSSFGQHEGPSSVDAYNRQFFPQQSSSFHQHASSVEGGKPFFLERESVSISEISNIANPPPAGYVELPKGQLVRVFCKANRSFNLAVKDNILLMMKADTEDEFQQWIRDDRYSIRVRDSNRHPAFMLINKGSKKALRHGQVKLQEVQLTNYTPELQDDDLFWTESQDFGEGFKTVRAASDTLLNLSVASSGNNVGDGSSLVLDTWHKRENQMWKIFPL